MSLAPGSAVGPYEVLGPLGKGGVGEVWHGRDAARSVADGYIAPSQPDQ